MAMAERAERFLDLSTFLTGFPRVDLLGTGMASAHLEAVDGVLPEGTLDELLAAYDRLAAAGLEPADATEIFADPKLGPVARNLILVWYCGTWAKLPDAWRASYGTSPLDTNRVLSAESYRAGLQWVAARAHPAGAGQQGYGAWALAPEGSSA